jgi:hypothetical protein
VSIQIMRDAADGCLRQLVAACPSSKLLMLLAGPGGAGAKHAAVRERCQSHLAFALETWPQAALERRSAISAAAPLSLELVEGALEAGLADSSQAARVAARRGFGALQERWPVRATRLHGRLTFPTLRMLATSDPPPPPQPGPTAAASSGELRLQAAAIDRQSFSPASPAGSSQSQSCSPVLDEVRAAMSVEVRALRGGRGGGVGGANLQP